jgi:hypothetical protein
MNIREIINYKPSKAITFMVEGLERQNKRNEFRINMDTFGRRDLDGVCVACAASCALQELTQKDYNQHTDMENSTDRAKFFDCSYDDLHDFELAIDAARLGCLQTLFRFCFGKLTEEQKNYCNQLLFKLPNLNTDNWENELSIYKMLIESLETNGY